MIISATQSQYTTQQIMESRKCTVYLIDTSWTCFLLVNISLASCSTLHPTYLSPTNSTPVIDPNPPPLLSVTKDYWCWHQSQNVFNLVLAPAASRISSPTICSGRSQGKTNPHKGETRIISVRATTYKNQQASSFLYIKLKGMYFKCINILQPCASLPVGTRIVVTD